MTEENTRCITQRIVITGDLVLLSPANLGNGDAEGLTDMPLSLDVVSGRPLLTGTSIAGALRSYLRECMQDRSDLFGAEKTYDNGKQSWLIVDDAIASEESWNDATIEVRDGVKIDYATRTAEDRKKYDLELIPAGITFPLRFELVLPDSEQEATRLKETLAVTLGGLEASAIGLGARKTRGFGMCKVETWHATSYDLQTTDGLLAWLSSNHTGWGYAQPATVPGKAATVLGVSPSTTHKRHECTIEATFALDSSMLIRSDEPLTKDGTTVQPDTSHIRSRRNGNKTPVLPGTSLAGALRSRANRILNTLNSTKTQEVLNKLFGTDMESGEEATRASRLVVRESVIDKGRVLVQNRVGIDRFTGGALDTALFNEAPQIGGSVTLHMQIRQPKEHEIGLLLLLLKDLWTSDLPLGGTSSVGRGRLRGKEATLRHTNGHVAEWVIHAPDDQSNTLTITGDKQQLEDYVGALQKELGAK